MNRMTEKKSAPAKSRRSPATPVQSGGASPAAPVGVHLPPWARRPGWRAPDVRPPSLTRFPGLLCPPRFIDHGGFAL